MSGVIRSGLSRRAAGALGVWLLVVCGCGDKDRAALLEPSHQPAASSPNQIAPPESRIPPPSPKSPTQECAEVNRHWRELAADALQEADDFSASVCENVWSHQTRICVLGATEPDRIWDCIANQPLGDTERASLEKLIWHAAMYKTESAYKSYLVPARGGSKRRWVQFDKCKVCAAEPSKTGNMTNMTLLKMDDPRVFQVKYGVRCAEHAQETTGQIAAEVGLTEDTFKSAMAEAKRKMREHADLYHLDHPTVRSTGGP